MEKYNTITINKTEYYHATDIHNFDSAFFYGCRNNVRNIVEKKKMEDNDYIYAYIKNKEWTISNGGYCKAKLLLSRDWCVDNVPKFAKHSAVVAQYEELPPKVELDENHKFCDHDGLVCDITMRGERSFDKCYFKTDDISKIFDLPNIKRYMVDKESKYELSKHYKYFTLQKNRKCVLDQTSKISYMTYRGVIKCLFNNNSKMAELFQDWCLKTLFTHQFGSLEEKQELSSKLLGVHAKTVKEVFSTSSTNVPCVYLFTLGSAKELRQTMNIDNKYTDDMIICKYGMTDSIERRAMEHNKTYGSIKSVNLCLKYYAYIDQQYISKAETDIKEYFEAIGCKLEYNGHKELIILEPTKINKLVKQQYTNLSNMYAGHIKDLIKRIEDLENKLILEGEKQKVADIQHKNELLAEKHINELLINKHASELQKRDMELMMEKHKNESLINEHTSELQKREMELLKKELELSKKELELSKKKK